MKKVAFICVHNSCRSQIAETLGKQYYEQMLVANERFVEKHPEYLEGSCEN